MVLSVAFTKKIVVGCRTDCHHVMSVEPTAIATNNKGLYKTMSISAEQTSSQKHLCCLQNRLSLQQWVCLQNTLPSQNFTYYKYHLCKLVWRRNFICNNDVSCLNYQLNEQFTYSIIIYKTS